MEKKTILIIEDEDNISDILSHYLENEGFRTIVANCGQQGLESVREYEPDLVLLDIMLPDLSGFEVCKRIAAASIIPVIIITARSDDVDKILGMELGADDYITKPFNMREVIVRIKTIFRRIDLIAVATADQNEKVIKLKREIEIFKDRHEIHQHGQKIEFTNKEYDLLVYLAERPGKAITREELLDKVWGYEFTGDCRTVDIHVRRVRKKLDENKNSSIIETVFGVGYKLV
ncbi:transcriptional regulatory protein YycF [Desulfosporosinus acididurans]|uniref:Stage 0 sporulation protein A homolog n=1 Tax=Desulfosporosinus acididurans TaxID=476652 RepID=A0A0J1FRP1_9FIRM|nr:response regulator transcription factor [Desulfosporosinus acididurans]KLU65967.1 transcriptional regulatory protein YycF [Desulfosporosinus acididurans]